LSVIAEIDNRTLLDVNFDYIRISLDKLRIKH
jgi:hypothetical protein